MTAPTELYRWTPPSWLRFVTPWSVLYWIDKHCDTCWSEMVLWKMFGGERCWWPHEMCFQDYDYCGKFEGKERPRQCDGRCPK